MRELKPEPRQQLLSSVLLGFPFRTAFAFLRILAVDGDFHNKTWRVVRSSPRYQSIYGSRRVFLARLGPLLQRGFGVAHVSAEGGECDRPIAINEPLCRLQSAVNIKSSDYGLAGPGKNCRFLASTASGLGVGQYEMIRQPGGLSRFRARFATCKSVKLERERALGIVGVGVVQTLGRYQPQYTVAQEFQPFIRPAGIRACMRKCAP